MEYGTRIDFSQRTTLARRRWISWIIFRMMKDWKGLTTTSWMNWLILIDANVPRNDRLNHHYWIPIILYSATYASIAVCC
jgi:hypothetical protein